MNLEMLEKKLIAAARAQPPSDRVPYAFEKRVMARLSPITVPDLWAGWARMLWRAAGPCVGLMVGVGIWTFVNGDLGPGNSLNHDLETTVMAAIDTQEEAW